ncbi:MAG: Tad domain-containing protein [Chloroflexi bacterium]|nr:Tad domain-containing protein [Chloroflexota bacterium]
MFKEPLARGQAMILIALMMAAMSAFLAMALDGGFAFAKRRQMQNAVDAAVLGTVRKMLEGGQTDASIVTTIEFYLQANGWSATTGTYTATYLDGSGTELTAVGAGTIPSGAQGVKVVAKTNFNAFFAGVVGRTTFDASAQAKARWGTICSLPGCVAPLAVYSATVTAGSAFTQEVGSGPGNFGWIDWGDSGFSGAPEIANALSNIGSCDPASDTVSGVSGPQATDTQAAGDTGMKNSSDIRDEMVGLVDSGAEFYVPLWDTTTGSGNNLQYHLAGFAKIRITGWCSPGYDYPTGWAGGGCGGTNQVRGVWSDAGVAAGGIGNCSASNAYGVALTN